MILNIFGIKVPVYRAKLSNPNHAALYCPQNNTIVISQDLKKEDVPCALIHEIVHSVMQRTGFNQTSISHDIQEMLCENIAIAISENFKLSFSPKKKSKPRSK